MRFETDGIVDDQLDLIDDEDVYEQLADSVDAEDEFDGMDAEDEDSTLDLLERQLDVLDAQIAEMRQAITDYRINTCH